MKITKRQLKQIIKEELRKVLSEADTSFGYVPDPNNPGETRKVRFPELWGTPEWKPAIAQYQRDRADQELVDSGFLEDYYSGTTADERGRLGDDSLRMSRPGTRPGLGGTYYGTSPAEEDAAREAAEAVDVRRPEFIGLPPRGHM